MPLRDEPGRRHRASPIALAMETANPAKPTFSSRGREVALGANQHTKGRINLKAVAEVLAEHGLDPTVELVGIVRSGKLEPDVQARILNELLQYTQPKLKSVEIKGRVVATSFDINDDQAKRIAEEFLRASSHDGSPTLTMDEATEALLA